MKDKNDGCGCFLGLLVILAILAITMTSFNELEGFACFFIAMLILTAPILIPFALAYFIYVATPQGLNIIAAIAAFIVGIITEFMFGMLCMSGKLDNYPIIGSIATHVSQFIETFI